MKVVNYRTDYGIVAALIIKEAVKYITLVYIDNGVVARKVPLKDTKYMTPLHYKGKPYPVARAKRKFKSAGKLIGITKTAKRLLA